MKRRRPARSEARIASRRCAITQVSLASRFRVIRPPPPKLTAADKAPENMKDEANRNFQEVAFAYAILSDEQRRRRYDATGSTTESVEGDAAFDWVDYFRAQFRSAVDAGAIDRLRNEYKGSDEERADLLAAYERHGGDMDGIYTDVMLSSVLDDDNRFRHLIGEAIAAGELQDYAKFSRESDRSKKRRVDKAKKEAREADELAGELGLDDRLGGGKKGGGKKGGDEELAAVIATRQQGRASTFMADLEAKYGGGKNGKRKMAEPPEEAFSRKKGGKKSKN